MRIIRYSVAAFEPIETEKILMEQLGLEMDYIHDFIEPIPAILWQ